MLSKLKRSVKRRLIEEVSEHNPVKFLKKLNLDEYFPQVIATVYLYTRVKKGLNKSIYLAEMVSAIGHGIRNKYKLKRDSALAARAGSFLVYSFEELGLLQVIMGKASNGHNSYIVKVDNDEAICNLWNNLEARNMEKLPSEIPYSPYTSTRHQTGLSLIKTGNKEVLAKVTPATHPLIFGAVNKKLKVGWRINEDIYNVQAWALRNKTEAFSDIWEQQNPEARTTKLREAKAIGDIAKRFLDKTFFHQYYLDFRW